MDCIYNCLWSVISQIFLSVHLQAFPSPSLPCGSSQPKQEPQSLLQDQAESSSAAQIHILHHTRRTKKKKREKKKEMGKTAVRAINVSWNLSHPCYNWQDKKDTIIKIQITGYCLGVLYIKILGWIIALQKCVSLSAFLHQCLRKDLMLQHQQKEPVFSWSAVWCLMGKGFCYITGARCTHTFHSHFFPFCYQETLTNVNIKVGEKHWNTHR